MVALISRTGRHLQRYNEGCRQVVGCIPYRYKNGKQPSSVDGDLNEELEVLVISSQKSQKMLFPKGGWEMDETIEEAASRESLEEAGVIGSVELIELGWDVLQCKLGKWSFMSKRYNTFYEGYMFPLLVKEQLEFWPEKNVRGRKWMTASKAKEVCQPLWMKEALDRLVHRLKSSQQSEEEDEKDVAPCSLC
ncbi:hypothetical protein HHK36_006730 [Tetracentron sinense]|uniref:Nudix hydrolase domain-containing protein n=1 Tax=Tetracentron sinense TaxID=13715 RepID=A0A835DL73_TETSI|nr:hypothetical protein HHK36_006730 [Tetracentron sinense]